MMMMGATSKVHGHFASKVHAGLRLRCSRARAGIDDLLAIFGGRRCWRVERPQNSVQNRRPSGDFGEVAALAPGASSEFS